tara:strand:+ start:100 stop:597 length:498 start_codon:yes stop_codon:yes gene_type:complete
MTFSSDHEEELSKLKDYIETRKTSLEEEIEETIHQALADAKDSLELIRENIGPKVDKIIQNKMELIDKKMDNWKKDFRTAAQEEVEFGRENLYRKTLDGLNPIVEEKVNTLKEDLQKIIQEEVKTALAPGFKEIEKNIAQLRKKALIALVLSTTVLIVIAIFRFT